MMQLPHELALNGVYFSPFLVVIVLALLSTLITIVLLNKLRLSRFVFYPQLAFVSLMTLYAVLIDTYYIKF